MKQSKIGLDGDGEPTITCNFHNSVFSLNDGKCKAWCTGLMGIPGSGFLGEKERAEKHHDEIDNQRDCNSQYIRRNLNY